MARPYRGECREHRPQRYADALAWLAETGFRPRRICDLGCGTGALIALLAARYPGADVVGVEVGEEAAATASARTGCRVLVASVLDDGLDSRLGGPCDLVVLGAVVHHLVGPTRRSSRRLAAGALRRILGIVAEGGVLVVVEPTFAPRVVMTALFWVKRVVALTGRRVEIGRWNNVGAPVVSYLTPGELVSMVEGAGARIVEAVHRPGRLRRLPRALGVSGRWETTLVARPERMPGGDGLPSLAEVEGPVGEEPGDEHPHEGPAPRAQ